MNKKLRVSFKNGKIFFQSISEMIMAKRMLQKFKVGKYGNKVPSN